MAGEFASRERVIELLRTLVSVRSPYFEEDEIMDVVCAWLNGHGLPARIHEYYEPKETQFHGKNVVGALTGNRPGPTIYLGGHLDTVKLCHGWTRPPFEGVVEGDRLYGVGALDMKSGDTAIMLALEEFVKEHGDDFAGKIIYQFVSDEEGPFGLGTAAAIQENVDGLRDGVDFAIIGEPSSGFTKAPHPCIALGARGGYNFRIVLDGLSSHAATPHLGVSALVDASRVICALEELPPVREEKLGESALCVVNLEMTDTACSVPDHVEVEVFYHTVLGETQATIRERVEKCIEGLGLRCRWKMVFRGGLNEAEGFDGGFFPYYTDPENEYVGFLAEATREICGCDPNYAAFQSIGDFNHFGGLLGIPTVLLGGAGERFHSHDEYVELDSVCEVAKIVFAFLNKTNN